ncbi:hypothetical protein CANCADRAFT_4025 [Tortispora caseinolytica NRRL Y-17796]|uniref:TIP41-like protein n=1 Tax=Tortispora caseinolytica NRRL Y-17796 TaxID=767744 RepID=A0A1E4TCG3_9ASCO|nr:hypothetical protein CANCADRAFT_4025 [Tortispora caseinolytica NRRL Y-17796]
MEAFGGGDVGGLKAPGTSNTTLRKDMQVREFEHRGWKVTSKNAPILSSGEIEKLESELGFPVPEMIFGNNELVLEHSSGLRIAFNCCDALRKVDSTGTSGLLKVAYADDWARTRQDTDTEIAKPYDWTYTPEYRGTWTIPSSMQFEEDGEDAIPVDKLMKPDPILFFDELDLFEDELGDNGTAVLNVKIRIMQERLLVLCRFHLRVDDVLFRIKDVRIFVEFNDNGKTVLIKDYILREAPYKDVVRRIDPIIEDLGAKLRDVNWVSSCMKIVAHEVEKLVIG